MKPILNLDDLLQEDTTFILKGKEFTLDTSIKAFMQFLKWNQKLADVKEVDVTLANQIELIEILVVESEEFLQVFDSLNVKNQVIVLKELVSAWNKEVQMASNKGSEEQKK